MTGCASTCRMRAGRLMAAIPMKRRGCWSAVGLLFLLPVRLYQFAWRKPRSKLGKLAAVGGVSVVILFVIGIIAAAGSSPSTPTNNITPAVVATTSAPAPTTPAPAPMTHKPVVPPAHRPAVRPVIVYLAKPVAPPVTHTVAPPSPPVTHTVAPSSTHTVAPPSAPACTPLTNGGNCYEPGEFCRDVDHGMTGIAGDGKSITCENNDGWRWE
jgi:hypothetical protein